MAKSIAVLITKAPYGTEDAFAGLRLALAMVASGSVERTTVIMMGDGALNAVAAQKPETIDMPSNIEAIKDLIEFGSDVYCVSEDLKSRVGVIQTIDGVKMISWEEFRSTLREHELVTTF
ncbi:MAG: DsrE family protein [Methanomassiliicoccales archaeon]|nr:DsrE family protein [Methanomassiliicoccales archaeon]